MTPDGAARLLREGMLLVLALSAGPIVAALLAGLVVSVAQAATQIQEAVISYAGKAFAVMITLAVLGPWMADQTLRFVRTMLDSIALIR